MPIEAPIFLSGPIPLVAPFLKIGFGPVRQEHPPRCFELGAGLVEGLRGAVCIFTRVAARIKPAGPAPWLLMMWNTGAKRDRADANVTIEDVPTLVGSFQIAAAGEAGHGRHQSVI